MRAISVIAIAGIVAGLAAGCSSEPERTPQTFCSTYLQQKSAYIAKYNTKSTQLKNSSDPIATVFGGFASSFQALGDATRIFTELAKVSPDDIQGAVEEVRDSLKKTEDQIGGENPLSGGSILTSLLGGVENSLESSGAWEQVGDYIKENCHTT